MSRAVLWDLDGTLVDSEAFHWQSWRYALEADGVSVTFDQFKSSFGQRNDRILRVWLGPGATVERINRIADAKEEENRRLAEAHGLTPLPGAADWLARLQQEGWRQAIASSAPRLNVEVMLRALHLTSYFDAIVSSEDVTHGKPDPEVFLTAAARLGVPPSHAVVVEDAVAGVEAARRAGMRSVGVSMTTALDADVAVTSLPDLPPDTFDRLVPSP
jgi:HAD superfamily hydrolase (TIGR01509 family)